MVRMAIHFMAFVAFRFYGVLWQYLRNGETVFFSSEMQRRLSKKGKDEKRDNLAKP